MAVVDLPIVRDVWFVVPIISALAESIAEQLIEKLPMFNALVAVSTQLLLGMVVQIDPAVPLLVSTCPDTPDELFIWKIPLMFVIIPVLPIVTEVAFVVPSKSEVVESNDVHLLMA